MGAGARLDSGAGPVCAKLELGGPGEIVWDVVNLPAFGGVQFRWKGSGGALC
jgi:hypothetical protein